MKLTKNIFAFLLIAIISFSCSDDEDSNGPSYDFVDQTLQGKIDGEDFTFGAGNASDSFFEDGELRFNLFDINEGQAEGCDTFGDHVKVLFSLPTAVGVYELSFSTEDSRTATLYNPETNLNVIVSEGAIEILTITDAEVTGRVDLRSDAESTVNGNFTVTRCE